MIYVYDILLNWFQKEQLVDFFEWELNDELEHVKKIPLLKVDSIFIHDLYVSNIQVENSFLEKIKDKTECYFHNDVDVIHYACLLSDGKKCVALEFNDDGCSIYKSTLLIDEEEEVLELVGELSLTIIPYHICSTNNECVYLTRREEKNQNYLLKEVKSIWKHHDIEKLSYLYEEYFNGVASTMDEMYENICKNIKLGYSRVYEEMIEILRLASSSK